VEVLGYAGEPYLDIRPDGTWQNVNSPAAYINETLAGDTAVPASADPTAARVLPALWHDGVLRILGDGTGQGTFKPRVKLFTNWGGSYNAVVGVGDITGDGKADLVSRDTGGTLWRNNGNGKGSFGARAKIATGWSGYKALS